MHPSTHREAERIFSELLDLTPALRPARLQETCAGQAELQQEVQALLQASEQADAFFDALRQRLGLADASVEPVQADLRADRAGQSLGAYKLTHLLGRGGMGEVWCAERADGRYAGQVAIKLLAAPGAMSRHSFEREARHLARLSHPNIARLLDADATPQGQPYLVLECVDGEPIDVHCDQRLLTIEQRVRLFLQVLDAIAHAHANLVVHRDIKPSNVRVTPQGQVKVLDFGISKLIAGDEPVAAGVAMPTVALALTPQYAAPEQIEGAAVTTATDVYALGLLLWALVAGRTPRSGRELRSMADLHAAALAEPGSLLASATHPSGSETLAEAARQRGIAVGQFEQLLRQDLDPVLRKAVAVEPTERYATASEFAQDLRRYLAHEPVAAHAASAAYRLRKFVRRHRSVAAATGAALIFLMAGMGLAAWQAFEARAQRDAAWRAKAMADEHAAVAHAAERVAVPEPDLPTFLVSDLTAERDGTDMLAQLDRALKMVRAQYASQPELRGRMLLSLAQQYRWVSHHERADALFTEAEPLLQAQGQRGALAQLTCIRATSLARAGALAQAREQLARGAAMAQQAGETGIGARIECLIEAAWVERFDSAPRRAAELVEQALGLVQGMGRGDSELASEALNQLARAQFESGQFRAAAESSRRSIAMLGRIGRDHTPGLRNAWGVLAKSLRDGGQPQLAELAHGADGRFDPAGADLPTPMRNDFAFTLLRLGRFDQAQSLANDVRRQTQVLGDPNMERFVATTQLRAAAERGQQEQASRFKVEAVALFAPLARTGSLRLRALHLAEMDAALALGQADDAQAALVAARQLLDRLGDTANPLWLDALRGEARLALLRGDPGHAQRVLEPALTQARAQSIDPQASLLLAELLLLRAQAHRDAGDLPAAQANAAAAHRHAVATTSPAHPVARAAAALAR